jgi:hypothetical protein
MSDHLITEAATYKTHNKLKRQTSMAIVGFKPVIPVTEQPQTHVLDSMATGIGKVQTSWVNILTGTALHDTSSVLLTCSDTSLKWLARA